MEPYDLILDIIRDFETMMELEEKNESQIPKENHKERIKSISLIMGYIKTLSYLQEKAKEVKND